MMYFALLIVFFAAIASGSLLILMVSMMLAELDPIRRNSLLLTVLVFALSVVCLSLYG